MLQAAAIPITCNTERLNVASRLKTSATRTDPRKLATAPSQVLFGLKCGAKECLPTVRPTKEAAVSPIQVTTSANSSKYGPTNEIPCSRTASVSGRATNNRPLELIPAAGKASTRGRRVASVRIASPIRKMKKTAAAVGVDTPKRPTCRCSVRPFPKECASSIDARNCTKTSSTAQLAVRSEERRVG